MTFTEGTSATVKVRAPSTLPGGYTFDATANGKTFPVTVPAGGVTEGDVFEVPFPNDDLPAPLPVPVAVPDDTLAPAPASSLTAAGNTSTTVTRRTNPDGTVTVITEVTNPDGSKQVTEQIEPKGAPPIAPTPAGQLAPTGQWRNDMCACFETCDRGLFWMGWCCSPLLLGQVLQRMHLNAGGCPGDHQNTFMTIAIIWIVVLLIWIIIASVTNGIGVVIVYAFGIYVIVAATLLRMDMRRRYNIPASVFGESCLDDCCCAYWCGCCTLIQMARHTHDENMYPYSCGTKTGLPPNAPECV